MGRNAGSNRNVVRVGIRAECLGRIRPRSRRRQETVWPPGRLPSAACSPPASLAARAINQRIQSEPKTEAGRPRKNSNATGFNTQDRAAEPRTSSLRDRDRCSATRDILYTRSCNDPSTAHLPMNFFDCVGRKGKKTKQHLNGACWSILTRLRCIPLHSFHHSYD